LNYSDHEEHRKKIDFLSGMFVVVASGSLIGNIFQSFCFGLLAEKITIQLKIQTYAKILQKPMSFFDQPSNNPGVLSSRVSIDTQEFHGLINNFMGVIFQGMAGFIIGMIIAFIFSWQLTLVCLGLSPLITIGQMILGKVMRFIKNQVEL
jgi:ATP-binding cassette, subfamily B (MDR/TAP), member 1